MQEQGGKAREKQIPRGVKGRERGQPMNSCAYAARTWVCAQVQKLWLKGLVRLILRGSGCHGRRNRRGGVAQGFGRLVGETACESIVRINSGRSRRGFDRVERFGAEFFKGNRLDIVLRCFRVAGHDAVGRAGNAVHHVLRADRGNGQNDNTHADKNKAQHLNSPYRVAGQDVS